MESQDAAPSETVDAAARRAGFAAPYHAHVAEVYRFVHRRCLDRATAEDVTHDVFLMVIRTVDDPVEVTVAWLFRVARNRLVDVLRRRARHASKLRLVGRGAGDADEAASVVEQIQIRDALGRMGVEHRIVLTLHYVDGLTIPSLAEQMGRTPKAVEALVTRARRSLRRELESTNA